MEENKFDVCIIGSGPGGFAAAMRAFDFGKRVCLIEGGNIGGAGIMHGAMTSKTLWELSKDYATAAAVDRGYRSAGLVGGLRDGARHRHPRRQGEAVPDPLPDWRCFSPARWKGPAPSP